MNLHDVIPPAPDAYEFLRRYFRDHYWSWDGTEIAYGTPVDNRVTESHSVDWWLDLYRGDIRRWIDRGRPEDPRL